MAKLLRKTPFQYAGKVHDLTVANSHSYNIEGKGVHNSACGSIICYVLEITDVDPIKYNLLFERFISRDRCLAPQTLVMTKDGPKRIVDINVDDSVLTSELTHKKVTRTLRTTHNQLYKIKCGNQTFTCSSNHLWYVKRNNEIIEVMAKDILLSDEMIEMNTYQYEHDKNTAQTLR